MPARPDAQNYEGIQALRFVAALLVVITHATFYSSERLSSGATFWWQGGAGVNIFFVISGFVMVLSTLHLRGVANGWKTFAIRRIVRIVPMYWLATTFKLAVMLAAPLLVLHSELGLGHVVSSYLFIPTVNAEGEFKPLVAVGWTLYFEMFFYALFALALFLRVNLYWFMLAVLGCFAALAPFRSTDAPATMFFDLVVLQFGFGMLVIGTIWRWRKLASFMGRHPIAPAALGLTGFVLLLSLPWPGLDSAPDALKTGIPAAMVVLGVAWMEPAIKGRVPKWLLFLGDTSYVLYLFHPFAAPIVPEAMRRLVLESATLSVLLSIALAICVGAAVHVLIERPATSLLRRLVDPKRASLGPALGAERHPQ